MFKYEYGQLPDALNMFLLRIDLCNVYHYVYEF